MSLSHVKIVHLNEDFPRIQQDLHEHTIGGSSSESYSVEPGVANHRLWRTAVRQISFATNLSGFFNGWKHPKKKIMLKAVQIIVSNTILIIYLKNTEHASSHNQFYEHQFPSSNLISNTHIVIIWINLTTIITTTSYSVFFKKDIFINII